MDNFSISYIAFQFRSSFFFFFFNAGPMLIAVFITEMVILHKYVYYYYYYYYKVSITLAKSPWKFQFYSGIKEPTVFLSDTSPPTLRYTDESKNKFLSFSDRHKGR